MSDPRLTPARADLAAAHLRGVIDAPRYAEGRPMRVCVPVLGMTADPAGQGAFVTELVFGEEVTVYDEDRETGLAWAQVVADGYVGYVRAEGLEPAAAATHLIATRSAQLYTAPRLKLPPVLTLPHLARVTVVRTTEGYAQLDGGLWCPLPCLTGAATTGPDFVAIAERFLGAPYLWGGRSIFGLDCSALVQLSLSAAGTAAPRDSDQQEAALGNPVTGQWRRGDLVFWRGHVGIMLDEGRLIHANAHHMAVVIEPVADTIARVAGTPTGQVTSVRRL
ncbi:C40 family peptidase [Halovulum dunhuangense]|uniref:C40 family peptidase n=1 Tax=Halovulum dunhuangense TaxID=1505036 RepID=A0A849KUA4_9RHOB|nr:C40 family peptidase [Halovulum dunhuangense]NNU79171.1 C40 family peptidase [Halovulum dunhuangense]